MNKTRKIIVLAASMLLVVALTISATFAYLTSTDEVVNTFTVGNITITLDEAKTDEYGVIDDEAVVRVQTNEYKLIPGGIYRKDPTVHVDEDSEKAWIFVQVDNGIANLEGQENTIADQIVEYGWTELTDGTGAIGVYYKLYDGTENDLVVFDGFHINEELTAGDLADYGVTDAKIVVTAYAIQLAGFEEDLDGAWDAVKPTAVDTTTLADNNPTD